MVRDERLGRIASGPFCEVAPIDTAGLTVGVGALPKVVVCGGTVVVVVVACVEFAGITTSVGGKEISPIGLEIVGPWGLFWGTKTMPSIPMSIRARETAHHFLRGGRFSLSGFMSPNPSLLCS